MTAQARDLIRRLTEAVENLDDDHNERDLIVEADEWLAGQSCPTCGDSDVTKVDRWYNCRVCQTGALHGHYSCRLGHRWTRTTVPTHKIHGCCRT